MKLSSYDNDLKLLSWLDFSKESETQDIKALKWVSTCGKGGGGGGEYSCVTETWQGEVGWQGVWKITHINVTW